MLHFLIVFVLSWFALGFICTLVWDIVTFKLKFFTYELRYRFPVVVSYIAVGTLLGPLAFIYGAYGNALYNAK